MLLLSKRHGGRKLSHWCCGQRYGDDLMTMRGKTEVKVNVLRTAGRRVEGTGILDDVCTESIQGPSHLYRLSVDSELHLLGFTAKTILIDFSSKPALFNKVSNHKCLFEFKFELIKLK